MKFNFRKISAVAGSILMAGMTAGIAAAASFPAPFIQNGAADVAIVYGTGTGVSNLDQVSATTIQTALASAMPSTSGNVVVTGENQKLSTSSRELYYGDAINAAYSTLSSTELPTVLSDGVFSDLSGTEYSYTQTISLGSRTSTFGTSDGDLDDPALYIDLGTSATAPIYNYTLSFNKNLNVSSSDVQGQKINILGVDYVIGASSTNSTLYLYGSGADVTLNDAESKNVTIGGTSHTVTLVAATGSTTAKITVDGVSKTVTKGHSYSFSGDLNVYVKDVTYQGYQGGVQNVELLLGANTLKLVNGQTVKQGADATSIKNTKVYIGGTGSAGEISSLTISVAAPKSQEDSLLVGESFTDPVFGGFKLTFAGVDPAFNSSDRGTIKVDTDNNQFARVTFTSAKAGSAGEQELKYVYDNDTYSSSVSPILAHQTVSSNNKGLIHVLEGENAKEDDWIVVNKGDSGVILEVTGINIADSNTGTVSFKDVITGDTLDVTLTNSSNNVYSKSGVNMFGGTGYTIKADGDGNHVNVTWSSSGTKTLFPRIKLKDGGWIAFMQNTTVEDTAGNNSINKVIFPDGSTTLSTTGVNVSAGGAIDAGEGIIWNTETSGNDTLVTGINTTGCSFANGPAILFLEPKKWNDGSHGDFICVPMTTAGTTEIAIAQAVLNGTNSGFSTLTSDTYKSEAVDKYGTLVTDEQRTNENGAETISYPKSQMSLDVVAASESATTSGGSSSALGDVIYKDSELSNITAKNVIVVGGSCINSVAATLVGGNYCGEAFTQATGVGQGQFLIKGYENVLGGKFALLVAGYEAADTTNAATYLTKKDVDTSKAYKGTSATEATLITSTA